jgi:hypothetical protein
MGILGSKYGLLVRICGSVDSAKDLVVIPDEIEEESDSDKEQDAENEVILLFEESEFSELYGSKRYRFFG